MSCLCFGEKKTQMLSGSEDNSLRKGKTGRPAFKLAANLERFNLERSFAAELTYIYISQFEPVCLETCEKWMKERTY